MIVWLFKRLAYFPLPALHRMGNLFGWLAYLFSGAYAERLRQNLGHALEYQQGSEGYPEDQFRTLLRANVAEAGKSVMELAWIWQRPLDEVTASVKHCYGWEHIETARAQGKGVIVLTPHFGCFELVGLYVAARLPMTCMYRRPRSPALDALMHTGRERGHMKLAAADLGGVRQLLKTLKRGEVIGILPDQVPSNGEGQWLPFFGRPAYTMTLIERLIETSGAPVMMCHVERLAHGQGYTMYIEPLLFDTAHPLSPQMNSALETVILSRPEQYLWSYNRYKVPRGVQPPATPEEQ